MSDNESQAMKIARQSANAFVAIIVAIIAGVIYFNTPDLRWLKSMIQISKNATKLVVTSVRLVAANIGILNAIQIIIAVSSSCLLILYAWALSATFSVWWLAAGSMINIISYGLALLLASLTLLNLRAITNSGILNSIQNVRQNARHALRQTARNAQTVLTEQRRH